MTRTKKKAKVSRRSEGLVRVLLVCSLLTFLVAAVPTTSTPGHIAVAPDLTAVEAEFGYLDPSTQKLVVSSRIDTKRHQTFGWRLKLEGSRRTVRYREEFVLPAPARVWQVGANTVVSPDRSSATTDGLWALDREMQMQNSWIHSNGDPKGAHVMRVWVEGVLVREFDFVLY